MFKKLVWQHTLLLCLLTLGLSSAHGAKQMLWQNINNDIQLSDGFVNKTNQRQSKQKLYSVNNAILKQLFVSKTKIIQLTLPLPNGDFAEFILSPSSVVAIALANKYPNIKTFTGHQVNQPNRSGRFDFTPNGFHGMFHYQGKMVFIEPSVDVQSLNKTENIYRSYYKKDALLEESNDLIRLNVPKKLLASNTPFSTEKLTKSTPSESQIRTYKLAITAVGEYSQYHGGTIEQTLAEIVTLVNRLNEVFQRDLSVKLELVANNDLLIFLDPATDPFANDSNDGDLNTAVIDGIIGNANYDIGHVVSTGGGGLAVLGAVCNRTYKGDGVTGDVNPTNDAFYIDYVAHEIGHQFGANHTFNGAESACSGNRDVAAAYEPGSASTIMGYAGICGSQNLQNHSDPYFHSKSIDEISTYINSGVGSDCGANATEINNIPIVDAGNDYIIPANTPFELIGSATDVDGDMLSYSWEEFDLGTVSTSSLEQIDDGTRPLFRVWNPSDKGQRSLPKLTDVLANTTTIGETYPTTNREVNFRLLVRDNKGGVSVDTIKITTVDTGEAFAITAPLVDALWTENLQTISWNIANTNISPILCSEVNILLSVDGGNNFSIALANNTSNDGSEEVLLPATDSNQARIKIACSNNVFYAVNEGEFTAQTVDPNLIEIIGQQNISIDQGTSITLTTDMFTYIDKSATSLIVIAGNNYSVSGTTVTPDSSFSGTLIVGVKANLSTNVSEIYNVSITVVQTPQVVVPITPASSSGGSFAWLLLLLWGLLFIKNQQTLREIP